MFLFLLLLLFFFFLFARLFEMRVLGRYLMLDPFLFIRSFLPFFIRLFVPFFLSSLNRSFLRSFVHYALFHFDPDFNDFPEFLDFSDFLDLPDFWIFQIFQMFQMFQIFIFPSAQGSGRSVLVIICFTVRNVLLLA